MSERTTMTLAEIEALSARVLAASGTAPANAGPVARSIMRAEADGVHSHGLFRLPTYAEHVRVGKVDGAAVPRLETVGAAGTRVDAATGFAHPAISLGIASLATQARAQGIAGLAVTNSYNCGVVGHHVEDIAQAGLVALAFVNAPRSMAPWGGKVPVFGTNPMAFAFPRPDGDPLVIDQSSSKIARSEIQMHERAGKPIPTGWAIDADGRPTTDAKAAMAGSVLPFGEYKGYGIALMVDLLAGALTGACLSHEANSFLSAADGPPRTGQFFIAIDAARFGGTDFMARAEHMFAKVLAQPGVHLPGDRRKAKRREHAARGVEVPAALVAQLERLALA
ncbi:MAG: Ldh family oxidoreductase [Alphaproteobacteria bacterium]|nr:Ldh family oxidoreductase [Alphaproteobacteria bacterium]